MKILNLDSNLGSGLFLLVFSTLLILLTPSQVPLYEGSDALSPRLVPYIVLGLIGLFGIILIAKELIGHRQQRKVASVEEELSEPVNESGKRSLKDLMVFIGMSLFLVLTAEYIGFTFAAIIVLVLTLKVFHVKKFYMILLIGVGMPIMIDLLFRFLEIYLPLGFWEAIIY